MEVKTQPDEFGRCQFCGSYYYDNINETGYCSDCPQENDASMEKVRLMVKEYDMSLWEEFEDDTGYGCEDCATIYKTYEEARNCKCPRFANHENDEVSE